MAKSKNFIRPLRVLVDMDGVMCDFEYHMLSEFRKKYPHEPFVAPDHRRTFYMAEEYDKLKPGLAVNKFITVKSLAIHFVLILIAVSEYNTVISFKLFRCYYITVSTRSHYCLEC